MTDEQRKCPNCGALPARTASQFCEFCGTELPPVVVARAVGAASGPASGDLKARFANLANHPELAELMDYTPPARTLGLHTGMSIFALVIFAVFGLGLSIVFFGACPPMGFLPLAIVVLGGYALSKQLVKTSRAQAAPLERLHAIVIDERTRVSGGGNSTTRTDYYATLEFPDGTRRELDAFSNVAGKITRGDMGVAYIKGQFLLAFGRLPV